MRDPQLFIVRVWHMADRFRAVVRNVAHEQVHQFDTAEAFAQFIATEPHDAPGTAGPPPYLPPSPPTSVR